MPMISVVLHKVTTLSVPLFVPVFCILLHLLPLLSQYFAIMVGGRWFMNLFWGVSIIFKGEEVDDIFEGGVETDIPTSLTSHT